MARKHVAEVINLELKSPTEVGPCYIRINEDDKIVISPRSIIQESVYDFCGYY